MSPIGRLSRLRLKDSITGLLVGSAVSCAVMSALIWESWGAGRRWWSYLGYSGIHGLLNFALIATLSIGVLMAVLAVLPVSARWLVWSLASSIIAAFTVFPFVLLDARLGQERATSLWVGVFAVVPMGLLVMALTYPILTWSIASAEHAEGEAAYASGRWRLGALRRGLVLYLGAYSVMLLWAASLALTAIPLVATGQQTSLRSDQNDLAFQLYSEFGWDLSKNEEGVHARIEQYAVSFRGTIYVLAPEGEPRAGQSGSPRQLYVFAGPGGEHPYADYPGDAAARPMSRVVMTESDPYREVGLSDVPPPLVMEKVEGIGNVAPTGRVYQVALRPPDQWWAASPIEDALGSFYFGSLPGLSQGLEIGLYLVAALLTLFASFALVFGLGTLNERRNRLASDLATEQERTRIARDAHDRVYNRLIALSKTVEARTATGDEVSEADAELSSAATDIRNAVTDLQRILSDGQSIPSGGTVAADAPDRDTSPLAMTIQELCRASGFRHSMEVDCLGLDVLSGVSPRAGWDVECIVEEALENAARHGRASSAEVRFTRGKGLLRIDVSDNGAGPPDDLDAILRSGEHHGLQGMRERTNSRNGSVGLSQVGDSTVLTAQIALDASD